jgi:hypothetical protein
MDSRTAPMQELPLGMSNCMGTVDAGFATALQAAPAKCFGRHRAWNFNGLVWYEDGRFYEEVYVYRQLRAMLSATTLEDLLHRVNDRFGWD